MRALLATLLLLTIACATTTPKAPGEEPPIGSSTTAVVNGQRITDEMIGRGRGEMSLTRTASSDSYGWSQMMPVKIGGGLGEGGNRTYQFLNTLRGPNGEDVHYDRVGTCCPFNSPKSPFEDGGALLEVYVISYKGLETPRRLYFNWYDEGEMMIPKGLTASK
jgi:hypothetical protein